MQTKNINIERAPNNNIDGGGTRINMPEKTVLMIQRGSHSIQNGLPEGLQTNADADGAPPLPPRTAIIFTPLPAVSKPQAKLFVIISFFRCRKLVSQSTVEISTPTQFLPI
ncbi:hypothetical protein MTP99_013017 [Tenebrio molitor]|nr:hypothetical protein MTP99_013017 [Tenebrio molitor]